MGKVIRLKRRYPTYDEYEREHPDVSPLEYLAEIANRQAQEEHTKKMEVAKCLYLPE